MKPSNEAQGQADQHRAESERKLVPADQGTDDAPGFDRARQGAPRSDDASRYSGQSAYGSLEKAPAQDELADSSDSRQSEGQGGNFGEGNYGGERGLSERGGLSSYGNSSGSRYSIDNEANASSRTQTPELSSTGGATGAAPTVTNAGQYAGEYADNGMSGSARPMADDHNVRDTPAGMQGTAAGSEADRHIHEAIAQRLLEHGDLEVRDISVAVHRGGVTLRGAVPEARFKDSIEAVADNVDGVIKIDNQIEVRRLADEAATFESARIKTEAAPPARALPTLPDAGPATFGAASGKAAMEKQENKQHQQPGGIQPGADK